MAQQSLLNIMRVVGTNGSFVCMYLRIKVNLFVMVMSKF